MSTYTGTTINDLVATTPLENCSPAELNDATRELKSCLKTTFGIDHLQATGKHKWALASKTATYTATISDDILLVTNSPTILLYAASGNSGKSVTIINTGTGVVKIDGNASEAIDGALTLSLHPKEGVTLFNDASNWFTNRKKPAFRGAMVTNSADLTVTYNTVVVLSFDTEAYDTDSIHSTATLTTRLSVPTGVTKVRLYGHAAWAFESDGGRELMIRRNGLASLYGSMIQVTDIQQYHSVSSPVFSVTGGVDYFELLAYHKASSATSVLTLAPTFSMEIIE